jgi:glycosyltransferase involved in cell wall biosynthesis
VRVVAVIQAFAPVVGGAQRQLERLAPRLQARGVELDIVTRRPPGAPASERIPGAAVHRVSPFDGGVAVSRAFVARGVGRTVSLRPDVIYAHDLLSPSLVGLIGSVATGAPLVVKVLATGPGGDVGRLLEKPLGRARLRLVARRAAAFVCLTSEIEQELVSRGARRERMHRIPNGIDASYFRPPTAAERHVRRAELGIAPSEHVALYCGRFADVKRLDVVVRALTGAPHRLILVGEGPAADAVSRAAREAGIESRVEMRAAVDDTAPLYHAADVFVSASHSEGMSGSVLEAMASGLPVVAARASGMSELLGDGRGVLLSNDGEAGFARALAELAADPSRCAALGRAARGWVVERYSLESTADALVALYAELLRGRRPRSTRVAASSSYRSA